MKIAVLTSVDVRHRYFVNALRGCFDVTAVIYENVGYAPATVPASDLSVAGRHIVDGHFDERVRQENVFFGHAAEFVQTDDSSCRVLHLTPGRLNTSETLRFLIGNASKLMDATPSLRVDTLVVFGTNLLKDPILRAFRGRIINMHLGLSPYYRGTATNFYPLLNEEPEFVGVTIHLIDPGIDSGPILAHARPEIVAEDMPHTIGCKAILSGIDRLIDVLNAFAEGAVHPVPQWHEPTARLFLRRDYHPRQVVELYRKIEGGLIRDYLKRAPLVANRMPLITFSKSPRPQNQDQLAQSAAP